MGAWSLSSWQTSAAPAAATTAIATPTAAATAAAAAAVVAPVIEYRWQCKPQLPMLTHFSQTTATTAAEAF
jgi:hypothetical protein